MIVDSSGLGRAGAGATFFSGSIDTRFWRCGGGSGPAVAFGFWRPGRSIEERSFLLSFTPFAIVFGPNAASDVASTAAG